jgi:hypothetical protein
MPRILFFLDCHDYPVYLYIFLFDGVIIIQSTKKCGFILPSFRHMARVKVGHSSVFLNMAVKACRGLSESVMCCQNMVFAFLVVRWSE